MKKILNTLSIVALVLMLGMVCFPTEVVDAATVFDVPGDYPTIQAAINAASSGDTVQVAAGTYYENIILKDGVQVLGAGAGVTTINGGGVGPVVTANSVSSATKLDGFTITNGNAQYGGGMFINGSSPTVTNCILWGDGQEIYVFNSAPVITYCDIQGGYSGVGNINTDPLFVNPAAHDYHLQVGSPCIDAGSNAAPSLPSTDFEGDPRILDGNGDHIAVVDMGVDEFLIPPKIIALKEVKLLQDTDGDGSAGSGDTLKYTVTLTHTGNIAATGVTFSDTPDANTTLLAGSVTKTQGTVIKGNHAEDKTVEVNIGTVPPNSTATVTFKVTINSPIWEFFVANQAIVTGSNFLPVKSDDPGTDRSNDPTITKVKMSPPVHGPGLSQWGIIILVVLFGGAMAWMMRRRFIRSRIH